MKVHIITYDNYIKVFKDKNKAQDYFYKIIEEILKEEGLFEFLKEESLENFSEEDVRNRTRKYLDYLYKIYLENDPKSFNEVYLWKTEVIE